MIDADLYWLAGLLEGEGSFMCGPPSCPGSPRICVAMTDEDVVARVAAFWGGAVTKTHRNPDRWKPSYMARVRGPRAASLMEELRPLMGTRRREQIDRALASFVPRERCCLTREQADEVKARLARGENALDLATEFAVGKSTIYTCGRGEYAAQALVAQLAERRSSKPKVAGSVPA